MATIKHGFLIDDNKIFDTKIQTYELRKEIVGSNIIFIMEPKYYKRLYLFEALLYLYAEEKVFRILNFNKRLKRQRELKQHESYLENMANYSVVYNYPPLELTPRMFELYKRCQNLKKRLD